MRNVSDKDKLLLQNKEVLKIHQDPLGIPGTRITKKGVVEVWTRRVGPGGKDLAVALINKGNETRMMKLKFNELNWIGERLPDRVDVRDVFEHVDVAEFDVSSSHSSSVKPHDAVFMYLTSI